MRATRLAAGIFVFCVWIATIVAALAVVKTFGSRHVPLGDDIHATLPSALPPFSHALPGFWEEHNDHRVPLPKLLLWVMLNATDFNLRVVMYFNVLLFGFLALIMILTACKIRGHVSWTDAFFPLIVMCLSQYSNFMIAWQVQFTLSTFLAAVMLCIVASRPTLPSPRGALLASACLLLLPLSGANGVAMVPALGVWCAVSGVLMWRSKPEGRRWPGVILLGSPVAAAGLIVVYFIGLHRLDDLSFKDAPVPNPEMRHYLRTGIEFLGSALGEPLYQASEQRLKDIKGLEQIEWLKTDMVVLLLYGGVAVLLLGLISTVAFALIKFRRPAESYRVFGLAAFFGANACVAAAVTWGRAPLGEGAGAVDRYSTLLVPAWCWVYLIWVLNGGTTGWVMQAALLIAGGVVYKENVIFALNRAGMIREGSKTVERAIAAGKPIPQVAQIWASVFTPGDTDYFNTFFVQRFEMLQLASIGPYRRLPDAPPLRVVPYALERAPAGVENAIWTDGVLQVLGPNAWLVLSLPEPLFVYSIRVTGRFENLSVDAARFEMAWRLRGQSDYDTSLPGVYVSPVVAEDRAITVIVNETIDQFRIQPLDGTGRYHISRIELLVPAEAER